MKKVFRWFKKMKFEMLISLAVFVTLGSPLVAFPSEKTFYYTADPDVVYITNTLLYAKYGMISYADHPGTPTISFLNLSYFPLRFMAKYIIRTPFLDWAFDNYAFLTLYSRWIQVGVFSSAILVLLMSIRMLAPSRSLAVLAAGFVLAFGGKGLAISVAPENLSFFFVSVWLVAFSHFVKNKTYITSLVLIVISGFLLSNKLTNVGIFVTSLLSTFYVRRIGIEQKILRLQLGLLIASLCFYLGVLPAIDKITYIRNFAQALYSHTGVYGTGKAAIFDLSQYLLSATSLAKGHVGLVLSICFLIGLVVYFFTRDKTALKNPIFMLAIVSVLSVTIFAKYPFIHYSYINVVLIAYSLSVILYRFRPIIYRILCVVFLVISIFSVGKHLDNTFSRLGDVGRKNYYDDVESWTVYWTNDLFREQFNRVSPELEFNEGPESHFQKN